MRKEEKDIQTQSEKGGELKTDSKSEMTAKHRERHLRRPKHLAKEKHDKVNLTKKDTAKKATRPGPNGGVQEAYLW
jgi:hypothetical protein